MEVNSSKKCTSFQLDCFHEEKRNATLNKNGTHSFNTAPPLNILQYSAKLMLQLKSHIYLQIKKYRDI